MPSLKSIRQGVTTQLGVGFVSIYDSLGELPITNVNQGDAAYVRDVNNYYISDGSGWRNTSLSNKDPYWEIEPSDSDQTIVDSATPLIIIAKANDSDNPNLVNQSVGTDSAQYMVDVTNDSSVFTFTPKTKLQIAEAVAAGNLTDSNGDFVYTFKWSDGINFVNKDVTIIYNTASGGGGIGTWGGNRGIFAGGYTQNPTTAAQSIDYIDISTPGNGLDFGDLTIGRTSGCGVSNGSRGVMMGGATLGGAQNFIDYISIPTLGNGTDFGDMLTEIYYMAGVSDGTRGFGCGGMRGPAGSYQGQNSIQYVTIATAGNSTDGADLTSTRVKPSGWNDTTRAVVMGGRNTSDGGPLTNYIDYFTMANLSTNASDFGDLTDTWDQGAGGGDATYALHASGRRTNSSYANGWTENIDYITIQSTGNAQDFGDMTTFKSNVTGASDGTYATFAGGDTNTGSNTRINNIDYVTVATPGNATDFGDITQVKEQMYGCSGSSS